MAKIDPLVVFGAQIRELRTQRGYSQEKLAELSGLHRNYVGDAEREVRNIGLLNILRLARALDVLPTELLKPYSRLVMKQLPSVAERPSRRDEK